MQYKGFSYKTAQQFQGAARELGVHIPWAGDVSALGRPLGLGRWSVPNRIAIQPMEGCDGDAGGTPGELTRRRYIRFARGGAGLIWFEAVAVAPEGRANPRQLFINPGNLAAYKSLLDDMRQAALRANGYAPLIICQLTHSGRYSKPRGVAEPIIAYNNPLYEKDAPIDGAFVAGDDYLKSLEDAFGAAAGLAGEAGFDGVDIKCCHRYLLSELLSAYTRPGPYGGSFENRARLLLNSIASAKARGNMLVTTRLNLYDGFPYPYGFGVARDGSIEPDLTEPVALARMLRDDYALPVINCTIGNPYVNPHVNRPYDGGIHPPPEHPLVGLARMMRCVGEIKKALPGMAIISSAHSYPRQYAGHVAAGVVEEGVADMAGFGRMALAYPGFAGDILKKGALDPKLCCLTCGKCTELMRMGRVSGCPVRDDGVYLPIYRG